MLPLQLATVFVGNLTFGLFYFESPFAIAAQFATMWTSIAYVFILTQRIFKPATGLNGALMVAVIIMSAHSALAMFYFNITTGAAFSFATIYLLTMFACGLLFAYVRRLAFG